jgi:hypothetical protein
VRDHTPLAATADQIQQRVDNFAQNFSWSPARHSFGQKRLDELPLLIVKSVGYGFLSMPLFYGARAFGTASEW